MTISPDIFKSHFDYHRSKADVSLENYVRQKRIELGEEVTSIQRIYLDQRFWILFRDVSLGRLNNQNVSDLLNHIKILVKKGESVCPISESVFVELRKRNDDFTRIETAKLIDDLSRGICLIPFFDRVKQELCGFFYKLAGEENLYPVNQLVWTKLAYILSETHPYSAEFPKEEMLILQKSFFDHLWNSSLSDIIESLGKQTTQGFADTLADTLNENNKAHQSDTTSYEQLLKVEFMGTLSLFDKEIKALSTEIIQRGYADFEARLLQCFKKNRFNELALAMPTLHIGAVCHAAVRWDKKRNLVGNDLFDFHHAQAALGYCDVFLSEKPLIDLLKQNRPGFSENYTCELFHSPAEALEWLQDRKRTN